MPNICHGKLSKGDFSTAWSILEIFSKLFTFWSFPSDFSPLLKSGSSVRRSLSLSFFSHLSNCCIPVTRFRSDQLPLLDSGGRGQWPAPAWIAAERHSCQHPASSLQIYDWAIFLAGWGARAKIAKKAKRRPPACLPSV